MKCNKLPQNVCKLVLILMTTNHTFQHCMQTSV